MPQVIKQEDGSELTVYTADELEAAKTEAVDKYKTENPPKQEEQAPAAPQPPQQQQNGEPTVADLMNRIDGLTKDLRARDIDAAAARYAGADPEKQNEYKTAFDRLTGYEATPEGFAQQAAAAAKLAFGTDAPVSVEVPVGVGHGKTNTDQAPLSSDKDKAIQSALGIKADDVTKYGPEATKDASNG